MLRLLSNTAGVDEDEVGLLGVFRLCVIGSFQKTKDPLRVVFIHLTAIGFEINTLPH
jgi:hypothetical protein